MANGTMTAEPLVLHRYAVHLDGKTSTMYEQQAAAAGKTVEELMAQRLQECVDQNTYSGRTVKISPEDRQIIEKALGRGLKDGHELAQYLQTSFSLECANVDVHLSPELLRRLETRVPRGVPRKEFIGRIVRDQLEHYVGLR